MGCDIHLHIEVRIEGVWHHYAAPTIRADYELFAKLAGVRGDLADAVAKPKGLPPDMTRITQMDAEQWADDAHTASWLDAEEIAVVSDWYEKQDRKFAWMSAVLGCSLFGCEWRAMAREPEDAHEDPRSRAPGLEDVRWLFWFDN